MFAEVSDVVWQALIAACVAIYMEWSRRRTAERVEEVKTNLNTATEITTGKMDDLADKVNKVEAGVEIVHKATNSLTEQLVKKTEAEALARGGVEERARADARKES